MRGIFFEGPYPWTYYLTGFFGEEDVFKVSEDDFFDVVGFNRTLIPMRYDSNNINRQNFYMDDILLGYRVR